jgi:hypothetical protein
MTTFKVGDRVKLVNNSYHSVNKVGFIGYVVQVDRDTHRKCPIYRVAAKPGHISDDGNWSIEHDLVACPEVVYEDEWHLNTGAVEIPDDADKAWNSDKTSVVAFRYVKKPEVVVKEQFLSRTFDGIGFNVFHGKYNTSIAKLTFTTTDGELTDIQWEKL